VPTTLKRMPIVFVGTYTEAAGSQSEGIYVYRMDSSSGELSFISVIKGIINPSFLDVHPRRSFLYAVNEVQSFDRQFGGGVSAFSINSGELSLLNQQPSYGKDPCYISVEQTGKFCLSR
jgi:6-phosphogluconolactonase